MIVWYVCPYDVTKDPDGVLRTPAMHRYIPRVPNADGSNWDEAEILGNHIVVKVEAPLAVHATIQADPDFLVVPTGTIPANRQAVVKTKLLALGYTDAEITATQWIAAELLARLTVAVSSIQKNAAGDGVDVLPGRRPSPKTVAQINARLPG